MNLATSYLGLSLSSPFVVGASPFSENTSLARKLQDAGAGALVMRSLFEEQIEAEAGEISVRAPFDQQPSPTSTVRQLEDLKSNLSIPIVASINGTRPGPWIDYARRLEKAGADAIELNLYRLVTDPRLSGEEAERGMIEMVRQVAATVRVPVAVKLSPFHAAPIHFISSLEAAGAAGVVLFNRLYQPDFNIEDIEPSPETALSEPTELLLRLRWLAIATPHVRGTLVAAGGVHSGGDAVKAILAGAHAVQVVSVLLKNGPLYVTTLIRSLHAWMEKHGYDSVAAVRGALSHRFQVDSAAVDRSDYVRMLQAWRL